MLCGGGLGFEVYRLSLAKKGPSNLSIPFPLPLVHLARRPASVPGPVLQRWMSQWGRQKQAGPLKRGFGTPLRKPNRQRELW